MNKFSFTVKQGEKWETPYDLETSEIKKNETYFNPSNFPEPVKMTIKELKKILRKDFFFKRFISTTGSANRVNKNGGFAGDMVKPILISDTGEKRFGKKITDGNHTANMMCTLYDDDVEVTVMMYNHTGERAAKAFALWNKEGVKILTQEEVFPAQYLYGDKQAKLTFDVLNQSGRTFNRMPVGDPTFNMIAKNLRVTKRGYLERAIKVDQDITLDVLALLKSAYPNDDQDNAVLTYALVKGLKKTSVLFEKDDNGLPADLFVEYFNELSQTRSQDGWLFASFRIHNKEAESIFAIILREFLDYAKNYKDVEWYDECLATWNSDFEKYYNEKALPQVA